MSEEAKDDKQKRVCRSTTYYCIPSWILLKYGQNPDIDSTALMILTNAWDFNRTLRLNPLSGNSAVVSTIASENSPDYVSCLLLKLEITGPKKAFDFLFPLILMIINYLLKRDTGDDDLLERNHDEGLDGYCP